MDVNVNRLHSNTARMCAHGLTSCACFEDLTMRTVGALG